ncbi:MAG: Rrf2 family transcriptional regulator [Epsilonproteobacteria bacterium]|nr:Rrf2 family transcriptional regulator [Campylobacterota bacterium]
MLLNATTQYSLKILFYLKEHSEALVSAKVLSERLDIPYKYLTKILTKLTKNEYIESIQGRYGGFRLLNGVHIKVEDIVLMEGDDFRQCIMGNGICKERGKCQLHDSWKEPKKAIIEQLLGHEI